MFNWEKLTYKQRNRVLLGGMVLLMIICYQFGVRNTLDLSSQVSEQQVRLQQLNNYPERLQSNLAKLKNINGSVDQYVRDDNFNQDEILESLSEFCGTNKLVIRSFPKSKLKRKNDILIETHRFEVEGGFTSLVELLYHIEVTEKLGRIASSNFETRLDRKTRRKRLFLTVYLQNIRNENGKDEG